MTTTTYRAINLAYQLAHDGQAARAAATGADVLVLFECRTRDNEPIDVKALLGEEWSVWQNLTDAAHAGTVIALRKHGTARPRPVANAAARALERISRPGRHVQARYGRTLRIRDAEGSCTVLAWHVPLGSTGRHDEAMRQVETMWARTRGRRRGFADGNQPPATFARALSAPNHYGADVMVTVWTGTHGRAMSRRVAFTDHRVITLHIDG